MCQSRPYAANSINPLKTHWQLMMHIETPLPVVSRTGPHTSGRAHHCPISHFIHTSVFSGHHSSQMTQQCVMQLVCFTPLTCLQFHTLCYSTFSYKNSFQQMLVSAWWRKCIHYLFWFSFLSILSSHLFLFFFMLFLPLPQVWGTTWRKLWSTSSQFMLRYKKPIHHEHYYLILFIQPSFNQVCFCLLCLLVHVSQVFTVSKDLVPRVLSRIVESVADEMCRLMQCVSSFSKNGALQVLTDTNTEQFLTHSKTLTHKSTPTLVGDLPVVSDKARFQFKLPTADSWRCSFDFIFSFSFF